LVKETEACYENVTRVLRNREDGGFFNKNEPGDNKKPSPGKEMV